MTTSNESRPEEPTRMDLVRCVAPALALLSLALAVVTSNFDAKLTHIGLTLMLVCVMSFMFHVKDRPVAQRPPTKFDPIVLLLIGGFCLGAFFCGLSFDGSLGLAVQFLPTFGVVATGIWLNSRAGRAKRAGWAERDK